MVMREEWMRKKSPYPSLTAGRAFRQIHQSQDLMPKVELSTCALIAPVRSLS